MIILVEGCGQETKSRFMNPGKETMKLVGVKVEVREKWTDWRQMIHCDDP